MSRIIPGSRNLLTGSGVVRLSGNNGALKVGRKETWASLIQQRNISWRKDNRNCNNITVFCSKGCKQSIEIIDKLSAYSQAPNTFEKYAKQGFLWSKNRPQQTRKFEIDLRIDNAPLYEEYLFLRTQCMEIHPDNIGAFKKVFPDMMRLQMGSGSSVLTEQPKQGKTFLQDFEVLPRQEYERSLEQRKEFFRPPLVVDWSNRLMSLDDANLDRVLSNYMSCGIQQVDKGQPFTAGDNYQSQQLRSTGGSAAGIDTVHPHVAEFADLF